MPRCGHPTAAHKGWTTFRVAHTAHGPDDDGAFRLPRHCQRITISTASSGTAFGENAPLTLAAQDTIADAIAGVIILFDRPFRIGDRIEIQGAGTWGDVVDIGLRATRIRMRDNRLVILPNSTIGKSQVMNYSYPDPSHRSETQISVGYDTNLEAARCLIINAIEKVDGVLTNRPIDALYIEMGPSGIIFRVRWWIRNYRDRTRCMNQVHTALQATFSLAGIPFAPTTQSVKLQVNPETVRRVSSTFKGRSRSSPGGAGSGGQTDA